MPLNKQETKRRNGKQELNAI